MSKKGNDKKRMEEMGERMGKEKKMPKDVKKEKGPMKKGYK